MSSESIPPQLRGIVSTYIDAPTTSAPTTQAAGGRRWAAEAGLLTPFASQRALSTN
ncbi:hypothetical protein PQI66_06955 [Corynebacterium sp. USCH3]|uniref:hypothetical protein n=1 Tax=Corynebacterium sp. USCH3 TaxID=3024840 RepID=UPI0030B4B5F5